MYQNDVFDVKVPMGQLFNAKKIVFAYYKVSQKKVGNFNFHYEYLEENYNGL